MNGILKISLVLAIFCLSCGQEDIADKENKTTFAISPGHPRILITAEQLDELRDKCKKIPFNNTYEILKKRVEGWQSPTRNRYLIGYQIQALVFVAAIEHYTLRHMAKVDQWISDLFTHQKAVDLARLRDPGVIWGSADIILGLSMAYDWLYPALPKEKRQRYGTYIRDFQVAVIEEQGGMQRDPSRSDYSNQFYYFDGTMAFTGLTLYREGIDDNLALDYLHTAWKYLRENMIPTVNQVGAKNGGWHEGLGYVDRAITWFSLQMEAWRVGTGENLFSQTTGLKKLSQWVFYSTQPDGVLVNIGDVSGWPRKWDDSMGRRSVILAAQYKDGFSQYIVNRIDLAQSRHWPFIPYYLLWYDPEIAEVNVSSLGTDMLFSGIGWVSMRNHWSKDSTFALFHCGNFYFGHQHLDQNSFIIFKHAPLAIDSGIYNSGTPRLKWATRFHNTILVGEPRAENSLNDGSAGQLGAAPMFFLPDPEQSDSDKGDILTFETSKSYCYVVGDASKAYNDNVVKEYIRQFLYIKPDMFIVLDKVAVKKKDVDIRWLLQTKNPPTVNGSEARIINGKGMLFFKTLIPKQSDIIVEEVFKGQPEYKGGNYRLQIIPVKGAPATEKYFLHALYTGAVDETDIPEIFSLESDSGNLVGSVQSNLIVLLGKRHIISTPEIYEVDAKGNLQHLLCGLVPGGQYEVRRKNELIAFATASSNGVMQFRSDGGGRFRIQVTKSKMSS